MVIALSDCLALIRGLYRKAFYVPSVGLPAAVEPVRRRLFTTIPGSAIGELS